MRYLVVSLLLVAACGDNDVFETDGGPSVDALVIVDAPPNDVSIDAPTPDAPGFQFACELTELEPLFTCVSTNCADDLSTTCFLTSCGLLLLGLSNECRTCLITAVTGQDPAMTAEACGISIPGL